MKTHTGENENGKTNVNERLIKEKFNISVYENP